MNEPETASRGWRILRRLIVGAAVFATLVTIFYSEEDWRGKRDWENCKRDLEAKGYVMDWQKLVPPPVPDESNFFTASPEIEKIFIKERNRASTNSQAASRLFWPDKIPFPELDLDKKGPIVIANLTVVPVESVIFESVSNVHVFNINDPAARIEASKLVRNTLGEMEVGSQGFNFSAVQFGKLTPVQIFIRADTIPSKGDLETLVSAYGKPEIGLIRIVAVSGHTGSFSLLWGWEKITSAADYLQWIDQDQPLFQAIRDALKLPYTQIDSDLTQPYNMPVQNFITMRTLDQTLSQRALCYRLLGQPEHALDELTLLYDSRRILMQEPTGKPLTLVAAMVNIAITGVYADAVADGVRSHQWHEPQLIALQQQLKMIDLPSLLAESFRDELASSSHILETLPKAKLKEIFSNRTWQHFFELEFFIVNYAPRGWLYQNMKVAALEEQKAMECYYSGNDLVLPGKAKEIALGLDKVVAHASVWNIWARVALPNFNKAIQTAAGNQTLVNETQIACALERYRLAHGEYPETLDSLMPQFIDQLPLDIINGRPLHYHRTDDGKFLLYSVGWNEKDDGGVADPHNRENGDWVW